MKKTITVHNYFITVKGKFDFTGLPFFISTEWGVSEADAYAQMETFITDVYPIEALDFQMGDTVERAIETRTADEIAAADRHDDEVRTRQAESIRAAQASLQYQGEDESDEGSEDHCIG